MLTRINNYASHTIHLIENDNQKIDNLKLDFNNIILANNGIFIVKHNDLFTTCIKTNIPYTNIKLKEFDDTYAFISNVTPPEPKVYAEIIELCKYVNNKTNYEVLIDLYYNKTTTDYEIEVYDNQNIHSALVEADYKNSKYESNPNYIKYLQLHSHNTMQAKFSSIDDNDEKNGTKFCIFGVVGKLTNDSNIYSTQSSFRIFDGCEFIELNYNNVFNFANYEIKLNKSQVTILNKIIDNSKQQIKLTSGAYMYGSKITYPKKDYPIIKQENVNYINDGCERLEYDII